MVVFSAVVFAIFAVVEGDLVQELSGVKAGTPTDAECAFTCTDACRAAHATSKAYPSCDLPKTPWSFLNGTDLTDISNSASAHGCNQVTKDAIYPDDDAVQGYAGVAQGASVSCTSCDTAGNCMAYSNTPTI